jgi:hypothetical protein
VLFQLCLFYLVLIGFLGLFHLLFFEVRQLVSLNLSVSFVGLHLFTKFLGFLFEAVPFFPGDTRCVASFTIHILCGYDILIPINEEFFHIPCVPLELMQHLLRLNLNLKHHHQDYFILHSNHLPLLQPSQNC